MPQPVFLHRLKLSDFRNHRRADLGFDGRHVVFCGDNGLGKTNLLEAISFLSPGRGLRRAAYGEISREDGEDGFTVYAELEGMLGDAAIGTGLEALDEGTSRRVRINGTPARTADELTDHLRILWLTPAMDGLFTGASAERRRFLDRLVLSLDPAHGRRAADFERAMKSRNKLLADGGADPVWLTGLERQMAELGIAMTLARREMLGLLVRLIEEGKGEAPFPLADLSLAGFLDLAEGPAVELEDRYAAMLAEGRYRDAAAGRTLEGPHKTDLLVRHAAKDIEAARCSTGEQKALLTGLVLAHARLVGRMTGFAPILLLDEIAAHLDPGRRAALFDLVDDLGGQSFMTGTDRAMFSALADRAQIFELTPGGIVEAEGEAG